MSIQVLVRIFATLPELPGAWPPLVLACTEGGLVVDQKDTEDPWHAQEGAQSGDVCPNPSAPSTEEHDHKENLGWTIEGQQWLTAAQQGKARWACMNLSGPGPFGLVPRATNSEALDMYGHSDLVRVLSRV